MKRSEILQQIAILNEELLKAASSRNWPRLKVLEAKRGCLIRQYLATCPADSDFFRCISSIVHTDRRIMRFRLASRKRGPASVKSGGG